MQANRDWKVVTQAVNNVEMVLVPPGCFQMGSTDDQIKYAVSQGGSADWFASEQPVQQLCFDKPFWIDRFEVTNKQFGDFGGKAKIQGENRPRENVSWLEARDFCAARGGRLPTEAEWEYAARGPDSLNYPWGQEFVKDNAVQSLNSGDQTAAVGSKPGGISWAGALDMSGNVGEWVHSIAKPYPYNADDGRENDTDTSALRGMRGGTWSGSAIDLCSAFRGLLPPTERFFNVGFRCARDY